MANNAQHHKSDHASESEVDWVRESDRTDESALSRSDWVCWNVRRKMEKAYHSSQISLVGWYIASYIQRIDPVSSYENEELTNKPWAVWENRILVKAGTPDEALSRTLQHLESCSQDDYKNSDGVLLRDSVIGLTSLIPIYDPLEDGNEIEWIDHTGEDVEDMYERVLDNSQLEAFTISKAAESKMGEQDAAPQIRPRWRVGD